MGIWAAHPTMRTGAQCTINTAQWTPYKCSLLWLTVQFTLYSNTQQIMSLVVKEKPTTNPKVSRGNIPQEIWSGVRSQGSFIQCTAVDTLSIISIPQFMIFFNELLILTAKYSQSALITSSSCYHAIPTHQIMLNIKGEIIFRFNFFFYSFFK